MVSSFFYMRLALANIRRNKEVYKPYFLASTVMIAIFYMFLLITNNPGMKNIPESATLQMVMTIGVYVGAIFSAIFIFYANSFLIKRRKKEIGLYGILGLEKLHVAWMMAVETVFISGLSLICGLVFGALFAKLAFLILLKMIQFAGASTLILTGSSVTLTVVLFVLIFALALLFNLVQVHISHPIDLLQSKNRGEREPKGSAFIAVTGLIFLGIGYYIALTISAAGMVFILTLPAVICVIIGTYCLFIAGSIKVLRMLKRNKKIYYKPDNFISISGLIYRMKQNAVGLASICILCTMVIITMSTTVSLNIGGSNAAKKLIVDDLEMGNMPGKDYLQIAQAGIEKYSKQYNIEIERCFLYPDKYFFGYRQGDVIASEEYAENADYENMLAINFIKASDYEKNTGEAVTVSGNEGVLVYADEHMRSKNLEGYKAGDSITFKGKTDGHESEDINCTVTLTGVLNESPLLEGKKIKSNNIYLIVADDFPIERTANTFSDSDYYEMRLAFEGAPSDRKNFINSLKRDLDVTGYACSFNSVDITLEAFYIAYGGLLFVGAFLSILFLMAMVTIIYYKQLVEGLEDRERYQILIKVGIDEKDVRRTIGKQIRTIFFLPLAAAVIHTLAAFKLMGGLVSLADMAGIKNYPLFGACTAGVIVFVIIIYTIVYMVTKKIYYRIVH